MMPNMNFTYSEYMFETKLYIKCNKKTQNKSKA